MKNIKYLCIDDQKDSTVDTLLKGITRAGGPTFDRKTPIDVAEQLELISKEAAAHNDGFGLLLDLRLDMEADTDGNKVPYRGPTLAQELRTRMAEGLITQSFPIVLWSIASRFATSYRGEDASHDLFDAVYEKDKEISNEPSRVGREMIALASGYQILCETKLQGKSSLEILKLSADDAIGVYAEFLDEFSEAIKTSAVHYSARLLLAQLIRPAGLLVDEALLAVRLGVDISESGQNWAKICGELNAAMYQGPFSNGWQRWWWHKVEDWWSTLSEKMPNLRRISAAERITAINTKFQFNLVPAKPICAEYSTKFFALCVATKRPLDPINGFRVSQSSKKNWQDAEYVSIYAALNRVNKETWGRINPLDRDRFTAIKERGGNE